MQADVAQLAPSRRSTKAKNPVGFLDMSWLGFLPEESIAAFSADLDAAIAARNWPELNRLLVSWRSTAMVYAEPGLAEKLSRASAGTLKLVPRP